MHPSHAAAPTWSRFRLSSLALGAAFLFALAGLFAADQLLVTSEAAIAKTGAVESAALVEGVLRVHTQALQAVRGLYADSTRVAPAQDFHGLMDVLDVSASSFRRVWVTDSAGVIQYQRPYGSPAPALPPTLDVDTVTVLGMRDVALRAREKGQTLVTAPGPIFTGERGFAILSPIIVGGRFIGFAGGTVSGDALLKQVALHSSHGELWHVVLAGSDTVIADAPARRPAGQLALTAPAQVRMPGAEGWTVAVAYPGTNRAERAGLWTGGLVLLVALLGALVQERRQGLRLAERSAELERLSAELLGANRAKSEFLANVSHELRTPLNAIVGFVDLLRDGVYGELAPRQVNPVERVASSANHLRHLVDQVLDIAKMAAGRLDVHREPVDVRSLVANVASEVETLVSERNLELTMAITGGLPRVRTDPTHLRQIVLNLLGNAINYTVRGGITVRAQLVAPADAPAILTAPVDGVTARGLREGGMWIALGVADTGIGIAARDLERIFEEFEQVNAGSRGDSMRRGTGLGLAISRRLARLLGGDITVESEPDRGSTFTLWLPVEPADLRAPKRTPTEPTPAVV
ncbi:MAG: ATP-binding protein [Gemmatimonadaceae bacterium]